MKLFCLAFALIFACSCATPGALEINTPVADLVNDYPPVIEASAARQQAVEDAWRLLLADYRLPETRIELEPLTLTLRALPATVAGQLRLERKDGKFDAIIARESLRKFLDRARTVLSGDPRTLSLMLKDVSLTSFREENGMYQAVYRQMNFPFPLAAGAGEIRITVNQEGALMQMSSSYISPQLLNPELPARPKIEAESLTARLIGREFSYSNIAGQTMQYKVRERSEISIQELVIFPVSDKDRLRLHLAWQVLVGRGTTWTVCFDAMDGQELSVKPNFVS